MCLIVFAWQQSPEFDLVLAANRDEFHERPTHNAHWWRDADGVFGGRDQQAGGAWCAAGRDGRFAAVTNVREPGAAPGRWSRGRLVRDYLAASISAGEWAQGIAADSRNYSPFNLLVGDRHALWFVSNRGRIRRRQLMPGIHAVSNGHWGDRWPKTEQAEQALDRVMQTGQPAIEPLFELLTDRRRSAPAALPDTGIGQEYEAFLSPVFIASQAYGTRASTVLRRGRDGQMDFHERVFDPAAHVVDCVDAQWTIC